jgi:hypothetical protein
MEAAMRPTTAFDDNVFDFDYLLHPAPGSNTRGMSFRIQG